MVTLENKSRREEEDKLGEYENEKVNLTLNGNQQPLSVNVQQIKTAPASSSSFLLPAINEEEEV